MTNEEKMKYRVQVKGYATNLPVQESFSKLLVRHNGSRGKHKLFDDEFLFESEADRDAFQVEVDNIREVRRQEREKREAMMRGPIWGHDIPDRPHVCERDDLSHERKDGTIYYEKCYLCHREADRFVCFIHNEGCHSSICEYCVRRMAALFDREKDNIGDEGTECAD